MLSELTAVFAKGRRERTNLAIDLALLCATSLAATGESLLTPLGALTCAISLCVWLFGTRVVHQYEASMPHGAWSDIALTSLLVLGVTGALAFARWVSPNYAAALRLGQLLSILWPVILLVRVAVRASRYLATVPKEILILGAGPLGRHTALAVAQREQRHLAGFLAFADDEPDDRLPAPVLGHDADLERVLRTQAIDEVYLAGSLRKHGDEMQAAVRMCERCGIPFALPACSLRLDRAHPRSTALADGYAHYLTIDPKPVQHRVKRAIDFLASTIALILLAPLFLGVALAIKLESRGPLFFRQERVGQYGRHFAMLKFRSMVVDAEARQAALLEKNEQDGPVFKIRNDPRITRVGRFIRKFSIDELPQLINVLRGEMTIVGPRPPIPSEVAKYEAWQRRRLSVRPGLTCLWQVSGRNECSFERWMYLDMQYIDHWSLLQDLQLILKTFPVVISGRGAS